MQNDFVCIFYLISYFCLSETYNSGNYRMTVEPHREKTGISAYAKTKAQISFAVTAKLISAFVFATRIVYFLFFLYPKFQASSLLL